MVALQKKVKNPSSNNLTFYQGDKVLVSLDSVGEKEDLEVDNILAMVGYRPDTSITEELQVRKVNYHVHLVLLWGYNFFLGSLLLCDGRPNEACCCLDGCRGWRWRLSCSGFQVSSQNFYQLLFGRLFLAMQLC